MEVIRQLWRNVTHVASRRRRGGDRKRTSGKCIRITVSPTYDHSRRKPWTRNLTPRNARSQMTVRTAASSSAKGGDYVHSHQSTLRVEIVPISKLTKIEKPLQEGCDRLQVANAAVRIKGPAFPRTSSVLGTFSKCKNVTIVMPHNRLPGAPGGFSSPDAVTESSDSEDDAFSREPSSKRPCYASSRASSELDFSCPQGSGQSPSTSDALCE
ncbi:hypothetical protein QAD02_008927 [Eretmocerus hayati]|uniref:Uncharacterized protein n=1 Tax=Eretmocerus hayati TaxID=131215 RepID=A0ACC2N7U8_9HYME|nr:hypothetical protein QAD02_008927 [Eretmocerus hayati]